MNHLDPSPERWRFALGLPVVGADGVRLGDVAALSPGALIVRSGLHASAEHRVPHAAIAAFDPDGVRLGVTTAQARRGEWGQVPRRPPM